MCQCTPSIRTPYCGKRGCEWPEQEKPALEDVSSHTFDTSEYVVMEIVKSKTSGGFLPKHDIDLPMFSHCCEGFIEVRDISKYIPVFNAHSVQILIQDETLHNQ